MTGTEQIKKFIVENFLFGDDSMLQNNTSLSGSNIVDSTGVLEVINFVEETFSIHVEDDEVKTDNLDSIDSLTKFIGKKLACVA